MNYRDFICYDMETTSASPHTTQPVQLAAVVIHGRKLEIKPNSEFESLIQPVFDESECEKLGLDPLQPGAVAVHGKTAEILSSAPSAKSVWNNFTEYVNEHNFRGNNWSAPISVGYNIRGFDSIIVDRLCGSAPYNFGPADKNNRQDLFNRIHMIDMLDFMFSLFENNKDVKSLSADNLIRGYMGYKDKGQAHDALSDVIMVAELFCRVQKMLRYTASRKKWKGVFQA